MGKEKLCDGVFNAVPIRSLYEKAYVQVIGNGIRIDLMLEIHPPFHGCKGIYPEACLCRVQGGFFPLYFTSAILKTLGKPSHGFSGIQIRAFQRKLRKHGEKPCRLYGIASHGKEIVIEPNAIHTQYFRKSFAQCLLHRRFRRAIRRLIASHIRRGQCAAIQLPVGVQRKLLHRCKKCGNHVLGQSVKKRPAEPVSRYRLFLL